MDFKNMFSFLGKTKSGDQSHIKNLIEVALADGHFSDEELELITSIAKKKGISPREIESIQKDLANIQFELPDDSRSKFHQVYDLIHVMLSDKVVHDNEMKLCYQFINKFGYPPEKSTERIKIIRSNIENGQGPDETMARVNFAFRFQ